ncbi:GIY-YIG nuclease family protein [Prauserella oleivorans]|uniref:GIY-YIG nuclease family protein n=1 Tax=Prauserella oleivorans TaxID=1478153 RepID=A0ABW5WHD7_9PSEU
MSTPLNNEPPFDQDLHSLDRVDEQDQFTVGLAAATHLGLLPRWGKHEHSDDRTWHRRLSPPPMFGVPFWVTACVRLMPPRRRDGSLVPPTLANAILPAAQTFLELGTIDRSRLSQVSGVAVKDLDWLLDYLQQIGFLARSNDSWFVNQEEPTGYRGPLSPSDLYSALEARDRGLPVLLFCEVCANLEQQAEQRREELLREARTTQRPDTYIYVIGEDNSPHVKIGITTDLSQRLKSLQTTSPAPLRVRWFAQGSRDIEQQLHIEFARQRTHGEWFKFSAKTDPVSTIRAEALRLGAVEVAK